MALQEVENIEPERPLFRLPKPAQNTISLVDPEDLKEIEVEVMEGLAPDGRSYADVWDDILRSCWKLPPVDRPSMSQVLQRLCEMRRDLALT